MAIQVTDPLVFSPADYLNTYSDVLNRYGPTGTQGAADHWSVTGLQQGRQASIIFDPQYYLEHNADLRTKFGAHGYGAALEHFLSQGLPKEGRRGSLEFDVKYYLDNNPDLREKFGARGYPAGARHFAATGLPEEGRQGSDTFSVKQYIAMYPDVAAAFGNSAYQQAAWHWLRRGKSQERKGVGLPEVSQECGPDAPPKDYTRIFIALRRDAKPGTGQADDPFDGSSAQKFDSLLRTRSEANQRNLIVCIGPGTFQTEGTADFVVNLPHRSARGFTVNKNWKIHGAGMDRTTLQLAYFQPNPQGAPVGTGVGVVFSTHDDGSSGVEISDLTIDDNYSYLKHLAQESRIPQINLDAIHLRSDDGGNFVHRVHVEHAAGEITEAFPVLIQSVNRRRSVDNVVEYVTFSGWSGGHCTAIALGNAVGEVRNNVVNGYQIAYGGWIMGAARFHDNYAMGGEYGFITDSLDNDGVIVQSNTFIHPLRGGMVIGSTGTYSNFHIEDNLFELNPATAYGVLFQGKVTNATVARNTFIVDPPRGHLTALYLKNQGNRDNSYISNYIFEQGRRLEAQPYSEPPQPATR